MVHDTDLLHYYDIVFAFSVYFVLAVTPPVVRLNVCHVCVYISSERSAPGYDGVLR